VRTHLSLGARLAAAVSSAAVALTGMVVVTAAPAQAGVVVTDYGFQSNAYGTRVTSNTVALNMSRSAFAWISCTRRAGLDADNHPSAGNYLASSANPDNPWVQLGAVTSDNKTFRDRGEGIVGNRAVNKIADLTLSGPSPAEGVPGPSFKLEGLKTTATSWAKNGKLHGDTALTSIELDLQLPQGTPIDAELQQLLDVLDEGIGAVTDLLTEVTGNDIAVPGLGVIRLGHERVVERRYFADARAVALIIDLAGQDATMGTDDDSRIQVGRARARINKDMPSGVMSGHGYPLELSAVDNTLSIGKVGMEVLPCRGTNGEEVGSHMPAQDILQGAMELGAMTAKVFGVQNDDRSGKAWTLGKVARVAFGSGDERVELTGIVGVANVYRKPNGDVVRNAKGTSIGSLTIGGEEQALPADADPIEIPGLALIEFGLKERTAKGLIVTAVKVTLDPGEAGETVVKLGNARTAIKGA
jgi:hypothetical protein